MTDPGQRFTVSKGEWQDIMDMVKILRPLYKATMELSVEYHSSGAIAVPMTGKLISWYKKKQAKPPE